MDAVVAAPPGQVELVIAELRGLGNDLKKRAAAVVQNHGLGGLVGILAGCCVMFAALPIIGQALITAVIVAAVVNTLLYLISQVQMRMSS